MNPHYPNLFSSIKVGTHEVRNRICLPATLTNFGAGNGITERWSNFLVQRAVGGAGLIVSEIIAVDPNAVAHGAVVTGFDDRNLPGLRDTATRVRQAGAALVGQLWHPGRQQLWHPTKSPMGVSDQPDAYSWTVPHVMSEEELAQVAKAYVSVASRLAECGFNGVELHGAHGYLITQLLSPWSNTRDDRYGGDFQRRARFCLDVARAIRDRCGRGFIVGLKMPADEGVPGGIDVHEAGRITSHLAASGCFDYFAYGQGNFSTSLEDHVPDLHYAPGHFLPLHKAMRAAAAGIPVMALGRIGDPEFAESALTDGSADLIGMTRAQVADAAFANKAAQGQRDDIRPTVFNNFCWGEVHAGKPLAEFHNPLLGQADEATWVPEPAERPRRVTVVGTGPAGLEAAWTAAARGHRVVLLGRSTSVGGKLTLEAALPGLADMQKVTDYQRRLIEKHGVTQILGESVDAATVADTDPEVVVLATGAKMRPWAGFDVGAARAVMSLVDLVVQHRSGRPPTARHAALLDHDHGVATYAAADLLSQHCERVSLLTPRTEIAKAVNYCSALGIHRRLHTAGVDIRVATNPLRYDGQNLIGENVFSKRELVLNGVDLVVYATPRRVQDSLGPGLAALFGEEVEVHRIGDCLSPRNLMIAIHEGHGLGNAL